jgi:hypothetical protein
MLRYVVLPDIRVDLISWKVVLTMCVTASGTGQAERCLDSSFVGEECDGEKCEHSMRL